MLVFLSEGDVWRAAGPDPLGGGLASRLTSFAGGHGPATAIALSPNGALLAYRLAVGETVILLHPLSL